MQIEIIQEIEEETKHLDSVNMMNIDASSEPLPFMGKLFEYFSKNSYTIKKFISIRYTNINN